MNESKPSEPAGCTHGGDCQVPGHPNGPHGELLAGIDGPTGSGTDDLRAWQRHNVGNLMQPGDWAQMKLPCPASIFLMGGAAYCSEPRGHDEGPNPTNHKITIEWRVR